MNRGKRLGSFTPNRLHIKKQELKVRITRAIGRECNLIWSIDFIGFTVRRGLSE